MPLRIIMEASLLWHLHGNTFGSDGITALVTLQLTGSEVMSAFGPGQMLFFGRITSPHCVRSAVTETQGHPCRLLVPDGNFPGRSSTSWQQFDGCRNTNRTCLLVLTGPPITACWPPNLTAGMRKKTWKCQRMKFI